MKNALGVQPPIESISWLNLLIYGEPGVGKTHFIGTAQDHKLTAPLLVIDIDGGIATLRKRRDIDVIQVRSVAQLIKAYRDLYDAIPSDGKRFPYGTVAIDTFSELQQLDLTEVMAAFAKVNDKIDKDVPDQRGYGKSGTHMRQLCRAFRDLPCNTIFSCHSETDRDNNMRLINKIKLVGKLRVDIPGFLDIVGHYRAEANGEVDSDGNPIIDRYMQFVKTETTIAKDRLGAFSSVEKNPTIPILWDKLQATNKEN